MKYLILAVISCLISVTAMAQSRIIKIVVPFGPGGAADLAAKTLERHLSKYTQHRFVVDFQPGNGSMIGTIAVANNQSSTPTLLLTSSAFANNVALGGARYDIDRDFATIGYIGATYMILVAGRQSNINSVQDLILQNTGFYGANGPGTATWLAAEMFKMQTGVTSQPVFYKGEAQTFNDVLNFTVPWMFASINLVVPHVATGRVKPLAVAWHKRLPQLPDVPTLGETGVLGFDRSPNYLILLANGAANAAEVAELQQALQQTLKKDRAEYEKIGLDLGNAPKNFSQFINSEIAKMRYVKHRLNVTSLQ